MAVVLRALRCDNVLLVTDIVCFDKQVIGCHASRVWIGWIENICLYSGTPRHANLRMSHSMLHNELGKTSPQMGSVLPDSEYVYVPAPGVSTATAVPSSLLVIVAPAANMSPETLTPSLQIAILEPTVE